MENRTTAIIATIAAVLLCGCPGLLAACMGLMFAFAGGVPGADIDIFGSSDPQNAIYLGIGMLCVGILFVIIPVLVAFFTLRRRPTDTI